MRVICDCGALIESMIEESQTRLFCPKCDKGYMISRIKRREESFDIE